MNKQAIKKSKIQEQETDFNFWQTQSYQARLEALEQIRTDYILWRYHVEPRFQRVYRVVKSA
jgi:hypothetical protein